MLYIEKGKEPKSLTEYKKDKYAYYDGCNKDDIREALLKEQGYLCAYCMRKITKNHMKIEHWIPEKELTEKERLDYRNMLGCCEGHIAGSKGIDDTCDTKKADKRILIDPRKKEHINKIAYKTGSGEIYSEDDDLNRDLNEILNLNSKIHFLKENRKQALDTFLKVLAAKKSTGTWSREFLIKIKSKYENANTNGEKEAYSGIILWYINKKLK